MCVSVNVRMCACVLSKKEIKNVEFRKYEYAETC